MAPVSARVHDAEPSFMELARAAPKTGHRALLVVYPRTACAGSASTVFMDEEGTFIGAVAPGTAALLDVPNGVRKVVAVSSVEVSAPLRTWSLADDVALPSPPSGLLLRARQWNGRECASGQYAAASVASKAQLEDVLGEEEIRWLEPRPQEGQAWLDAHRERVGEVLAQRHAPPPPGVLGYDYPVIGQWRY